MDSDRFCYRVDGDDTIKSISENWCAFANDNQWQARCPPDGVVGRPLWEFIEGEETRQLYRDLFERVRAGRRPGPIPFRCDAPAERRFLELRLTPLSHGEIELISTIVRREPREPVRLLDVHVTRSDDVLRICSMCKKVVVPPERWVEIEHALVELELFEGDAMPGLTHGLCPPCCDAAMAELDAFMPPEDESS